MIDVDVGRVHHHRFGREERCFEFGMDFQLIDSVIREMAGGCLIPSAGGGCEPDGVKGVR